MTTQDILVKNRVFKEVGVDINFNLKLTRDCYIHTQRQIEKSMQEYAKQKCQELLLIVAEKADEAHVGGWDLDREEVLNAVDLEEFCS